MSPRCRFARKRNTTSRNLRREPFRLFFPLAVLASVVGVSLWPLLYADWLAYFPAEAHARLMIHCFVGGFAMGFLSTAFPKMIGSPSLTWPELSLLLASFLACVGFHSFNEQAAGDSFFLLAWIFFVLSLGARLAFFRKGLPPPGFVLAGMGVAAGIVGTFLLLIGSIVQLSDFQEDIAHLLLYEGFILGPILGVGTFLFPRFFANEQADQDEESESEWQKRALISFGVGLAVFATYFAQAKGFIATAPAVRAVIAAAFLMSNVSIFKRGSWKGSLSTMLRSSVACLLLGMLISGVFPPFQVAIKHVLFIGGYGLLILTIASRVTWGHSGRIDLAEGKRRSLRILLVVVLLALATRVVADVIPQIKVTHHIYAALLWIIAVGIWWWGVLRFVCRQDPADEEE